jgi:UDP-2,3-diacylglucosamine pyrophosphatase LpxH
MNAIIVSDLHIGSRYFKSYDFKDFLGKIPADHELILNGDVIDRPYAKLESSHQQVLDMIKQISFGQRVIWIRGNHDNGYIPTSYGKIDFRRLYAIGNQLLITHGDDFDDIMPRSRMFIRVFKLMHAIRVKLGAKPVHVAEYAKKWKSFYRVLRKNVMLNAVNCAIENGFDAVTCGHTHYAEDKVLEGVRYVNTGAWTESPAFYLHVEADDLRLNRIDNYSVIQEKTEFFPQYNQLRSPVWWAGQKCHRISEEIIKRF